jgi:hypothetical protein
MTMPALENLSLNDDAQLALLLHAQGSEATEYSRRKEPLIQELD